MKHCRLTLFLAAILAALLCPTGAVASRSAKAEAASYHESHGEDCAGCRAYVRSTRGGGPMRLDRARIETPDASASVCSDTGVSPWFPEEVEHLSAFLNSHSDALK